MRFLIVYFILLAAIVQVGCERLTLAEQNAIKRGTSGIGALFGVPAPIGEAVGSAIVAAIGVFAGHKHGRKCERKTRRAEETATVLTPAIKE